MQLQSPTNLLAQSPNTVCVPLPAAPNCLKSAASTTAASLLPQYSSESSEPFQVVEGNQLTALGQPSPANCTHQAPCSLLGSNTTSMLTPPLRIGYTHSPSPTGAILPEPAALWAKLQHTETVQQDPQPYEYAVATLGFISTAVAEGGGKGGFLAASVVTSVETVEETSGAQLKETGSFASIGLKELTNSESTTLFQRHQRRGSLRMSQSLNMAESLVTEPEIESSGSRPIYGDLLHQDSGYTQEFEIPRGTSLGNGHQNEEDGGVKLSLSSYDKAMDKREQELSMLTGLNLASFVSTAVGSTQQGGRPRWANRIRRGSTSSLCTTPPVG
jgi:hypothetical protein